MRSVFRVLISAALPALLAAAEAQLTLVLDDPLDGGTIGVARDGEFVPGGGWRAVGPRGDIVWELPRALGAHSVVELQVRNLNPPAQVDSGENYIIGFWETIGDAGGDRNIPSNDCFYMYAGTKYPQFKLKFHTHGFSRHEKNYEPFASFDPERTYTLRFEWKDRVFQVAVDGVPFLKWEGPVSDPHDREKFIQLGARNNLQPQPALRGPVYSNLKAWTLAPADRRAPVGLHVAELGLDSVRLGWDAPFDDARVAGYAVYRDGVRVGQSGLERRFEEKDLAEGRYLYSVSALLEGGGESARGEALPVTIVRPVSRAHRVDAGLALDGRLDETAWKIETPLLRVLEGAPESRVAFGGLHDDENLYVGIRVSGGGSGSAAEGPFAADAVEILIDGNNNGQPKNWGARDFDEFDCQIVVRPDGEGLWLKRGKSKLERMERGAGPIRHASARTGGGYTVEVAVPWSSLGVRPREGLAIGFDVRQYAGGAGPGRSVLGWMSESQQSTITSAYGDLVLAGGR